ncbi:protein shisa-4 [Eurytemora carolleeae]|uniref:protein shisa-4 n=1 Tax=Eurytemora carolleeae TaxID=1294199 RepID=UPI000C7620CA|nr:protein shisa-4 [Eurytemora carolleeae]|eukprot:XP_023320193.1 protein shisa-4-like [Eurytemora affinis]
MSNLQLPQHHQTEAVLGSEYCSGYFDSLKNWNNGFYCPSMEDSIDVFCCGSPTHKYCCTKKDQVIQTEVESVTILIGVVVGAATALLLLTMVACVCCSWCPLYRKKTPLKYRGSMYRLVCVQYHVQDLCTD